MCEPTEEMIELAMVKLGIDRATAEATAIPIPEIEGAFAFSRATRGGGRLLVDQGMETLFAASAISLEEHAKAFMQGRRS